jgi:hypothetical protein
MPVAAFAIVLAPVAVDFPADKTALTAIDCRVDLRPRASTVDLSDSTIFKRYVRDLDSNANRDVLRRYEISKQR